MSTNSDPKFNCFLEEVGLFGLHIVEPAAESWETSGTLPRSYFQQAAAKSLCGLLVPAIDGGQELGIHGFTNVIEKLGRHCFSATFALQVQNNFAVALSKHGSEQQKKQFLSKMLSGETIGAFLLTEPDAGSDASAISTTAKNIGQENWQLDGTKNWVTNGSNADLLCVYAQTQPGSGSRGIAAFIVESNRNGVKREKSNRLYGCNALGTQEITFEKCILSKNDMLITPGMGFRVAMTGIDIARTAVAAMCNGMLARAVSEAIRYTNDRIAFGTPIGDFQAIQFILAECTSELEAARALTKKACDSIDTSSKVTLSAAHAKKYASRAAFKGIADCMQVMGANGLSRKYPLARLLEGAKIAQYVDGASEILNVVIARELTNSYLTSPNHAE